MARPTANISLTDLLNPRSAQQIINDSLSFIANPPDPKLVSMRTANWRTGGPYRTLLYRMGIEGSLLYQVLSGFAGSAFLRYASGLWLNWLGEDFFDEPRQSALFATVLINITVPAGVGPIGPVPITVQTANGLQFKSNTPVTIPAGPAVLMGVPFHAAKAGAAFNVGVGTINVLQSPNVLGVTVSNPAAAIGGYDSEPDDRYRQRLAAKWGVLSTGSTEAAYIYWALTASPEVQKVKVLSNYRGGMFVPQWVSVVCGTNTGPISVAAQGDVAGYIGPRIPLDVKLDVLLAVTKTVSVTGNVLIRLPYVAEATAGIANSLQALAQRVPIGGYPQGAVPLSEVVNAVFYDTAAVYDVPALTGPTGPTALDPTELLALTNNTTIVAV